MKKYLLQSSFLLCFFISKQHCASAPYASAGLGSGYFFGSVHTTAMGGVLFYDSTLQLINIENPTELLKSKMTLLQIGLDRYTPSNSDSIFNKRTELDYVGFSVPVSSRLGMMVSLVPETDYTYNWTYNSVNYKGSGGINAARLSAGYLISENLSVGLEAGYLFGQLIQTNSNRTDSLTMKVRGFSLKTAVTYRKLLDDKRFIDGTFLFKLGTMDKDDDENGDKTFSLPTETSLSVGLGKDRDWFLGTRYTFKHNGILDDISGFSPTGLKPSNKHILGLGGAYFLKRKRSSGKPITLLGGLQYGKYGVVFEGKEIMESLVSFGVNLPFPKSPSILSFSVGLGSRSGISRIGLPKEDFVNISIGFNFMHKWFVRDYQN